MWANMSHSISAIVCVRLKEPKISQDTSWPCPKTAQVARALPKTNKKKINK